MSIRRFLSLSILAVFAIAGGFFVADRRIDIEANPNPQPIRTGDALQLGVLLTDQPLLIDRNQMIIDSLFHLRDRVNQCGGINQAPVFWVMITPEVGTVANAVALEKLGMQRLLWRARVHGAIAVFTDSPISYALYSDALNIAIEAELPIISPVNSQFSVIQPGRFDQFRRDRPVVTTPTDHWVRTIPSDRQQLTAVAQWLQEKGWNQVAAITPDTPRGEYLAKLLVDAIAKGGEKASPPQIVPYSIGADANLSEPAAESEERPTSSFLGDATEVIPEIEANSNNAAVSPTPEAVADGGEEAVAPPDAIASADAIEETDLSNAIPQPVIRWLAEFDGTTWAEQPPEAVVLMLDPTLSTLEITVLVNELKALLTSESVPIILANDVDSIWPLLFQQRMGDRTNDSSPHPLVNLYGITPHIPDLGPNQANPYGFSPSDRRSPPSVFYAWDGAALLMLAAESAGINDRQAIEANLPTVANPPGIEVTDVCQGLELLRQGEAINYQGISGPVDIDHWGNVRPASQFDLWQIGETGDRQRIETFDGPTP
ncbi:MAG: hypothetical protein VKJ64_05520 [Leptolyngbyaceae bacterium]|nr:hypothetical protein [Leptolyngbyaceae bacterium]